MKPPAGIPLPHAPPTDPQKREHIACPLPCPLPRGPLKQSILAFFFWAPVNEVFSPVMVLWPSFWATVSGYVCGHDPLPLKAIFSGCPDSIWTMNKILVNNRSLSIVVFGMLAESGLGCAEWQHFQIAPLVLAHMEWNACKKKRNTVIEAIANPEKLHSQKQIDSPKMLAWPPLQSLSVKKNSFFGANFGRWKTFKICWKVPVKYF